MNPQTPRVEIEARKDERTHAIIGAAMEVHRQLGHGFLEAVYQEALAIEMTECGIPFQREVELPVPYKGRVLACRYKADFICYSSVIVELKALVTVAGAEHAQLLNYLRAANLLVGLLLNFGTHSLQHKRMVFSKTAPIDPADSE